MRLAELLTRIKTLETVTLSEIARNWQNIKNSCFSVTISIFLILIMQSFTRYTNFSS